MQDLMYRMVARMLTERGSLSRNKNFEAFNEPRLKRAVQIARHLRSLQDDVVRQGPSGAISLSFKGDQACLRITHPNIKLNRIAYLNRHELRLLCLHPEARAVIASLMSPEEIHLLSA